MCKECEKNPVYEFTNKRKLCKKCFIEYFYKKVFYTIRKFRMIRNGDVIGYKDNASLNSVVLKEMLKIISEKINFELVKLPSKRKIDKIAVDLCLDDEAEDIVNKIITGSTKNLNKNPFADNKIIHPLGLFLREEVLLYAQLGKLKFKQKKENKDKSERFIDELEKKHPEIKRAIVNGMLNVYNEGK